MSMSTNQQVPRLVRHTRNRSWLRSRRANLLDFLSHQAQTFGVRDEQIDKAYYVRMSLELGDVNAQLVDREALSSFLTTLNRRSN
jgi:hypothetical protein